MFKTILVILCSALVFMVFVTFWRVAQNTKNVARDYAPQGAFVEVDGHPVHYIEMGEGPDLVLIHGASGNARDFTFGLASKLATSYRVIIFDRPGLGHTPQLTDYDVSITDQADLLASAAVALGVPKPIVAGQSFGGSITLAWAVARPDNIAAAVTLSGPSHPWEGELDSLTAGLAHPIVGPVLSRLATAWVSQKYVANSVNKTFSPQDPPEGYSDHIGIPLILRPEQLMANARQRNQLKSDLRALSPHYTSLNLPLEIVHGDTDTIVPIQVHSHRLVKEVKDANLVTIPGLGHMPQHLSHNAVIAAIHRAASRAGLR